MLDGLDTLSRSEPYIQKTRIETRQYRIGVVLLFYLNPTQPGGPVERTITYEAPFDRCDREKDYEEVWANFEKRFEKE